MLPATTERLKFLVAFRPGSSRPRSAAQMASTFQRQTGGRLLLNVVDGRREQRAARLRRTSSDKDARYRRTGEFPARSSGSLWAGRTVDLRGEHLQVEDARLSAVPDPVPEVYFGGSSGAAGAVAAALRRRVPHLGRAARAGGREDRLAADPGREGGPYPCASASGCTSSPATPRSRPGPRRTGCSTASTRQTSHGPQDGLARSESEGQRAHARPARRVRATPWRSTRTCGAGIGLVRGGAGTALVGSHDEVADRIAEYHALGIDEFVLSGYPHLEEAYWFGEGVLLRLARRGLWRHPARVPAARGRGGGPCRSPSRDGTDRPAAPASVNSGAGRSDWIGLHPLTGTDHQRG